YFIVHPVAAQRELARRIVGHWQDGPGQEQNDFRRSALCIVRVVASLEETVAQITQEQGERPLLVMTSAAPHRQTICSERLIADEALRARPLLLVFGTGWGLTTE